MIKIRRALVSTTEIIFIENSPNFSASKLIYFFTHICTCILISKACSSLENLVSPYLSFWGEGTANPLNCLCYDAIEGSNMIFHSLTFARSREKASPSVFNTSLGTLRMLINDKIMFDRYYCINSTKHGPLYYITSPHFTTPVRYARFGSWSSTHNLARALRDAW